MQRVRLKADIINKRQTFVVLEKLAGAPTLPYVMYSRTEGNVNTLKNSERGAEDIYVAHKTQEQLNKLKSDPTSSTTTTSSSGIQTSSSSSAAGGNKEGSGSGDFVQGRNVSEQVGSSGKE